MDIRTDLPEVKPGEFCLFVGVTKDISGDDEFQLYEFFGPPVNGFRGSPSPASGDSLDELENHLEFMLHLIKLTKSGERGVYRIPEA